MPESTRAILAVDTARAERFRDQAGIRLIRKTSSSSRRYRLTVVLWQTEAPGQPARHQELAGLRGEHADEGPQFWHSLDLRDLDDIAVDEISDVVVEERRPPASGPGDRFGKAAANDSVDVVCFGPARTGAVASAPRVKTVSTNPSGRPSISPCDSGQSSMVSIRPGSASGTLRRPNSRADPVSRNRPGRGSRSTTSLIASSNSGTRWTSSMTSLRSSRTKVVGSSSAARRIDVRSRLRHSPSGPPAWITRVLLPLCRAPLTSTTLVSASASCTRALA